MIFCLLVVLKLPEDLPKFFIPSRMVRFLRILQSLILTLVYLVFHFQVLSKYHFRTHLEAIVFSLKFPTELLELFSQSD